ncbi:MAG TPA: pyridoxal phosphate-dependent aminotransferase [Candidatus Eisenbacteria bacterium]|nr:pyridoxal phosphate-dependent aminotransferase [Candidatus Eisenbacteria bacterium]
MPSFSRRSFLQLSAAASVAGAFRITTEPMLAAAARRRRSVAPDAVMIDSNENPLGPSQGARDAMASILPLGGRYGDNLTDDLVQTFASIEGLNPDHVQATVGSTPPLAHSVFAFTSPQKSYVTADPGFELGMMSAEHTAARIVKVPLTSTHAHDIKSMLTEAPDAGLFYICNPNNPTGTMTPRADIDYLVANKPKDAIVVVDEAYIHFTDAPNCLDLVKAGKDVIVLRTFSKVYGLAGIRCGLIIARPDLIEKVGNRGMFNFMPVTALVAAINSLKDPNLVAERRRINATIRQQTFDWLGRNGYSYIPSESNCFMVDTKRPGQQLRDAMAKDNVFVGRIWPIMPTWVRITVGTQPEMERFQTSFARAMKA